MWILFIFETKHIYTNQATMLTFISCAKTMTHQTKTSTPPVTSPRFLSHANEIALMASTLSKEELGRLLHVNSSLAALNYRRFQEFPTDEKRPIPAILAYTGIVFKHIKPESFTREEWLYAQNHLLISSFLYGFLRPLDIIKCYRLEGSVRLEELNNNSLFHFWQPILTAAFIKRIKNAGGTLVYLASSEMKELFKWELVTRSVRSVVPEFYQRQGDKLLTVVVHVKMCRGEMTRYIIKHQITNTEDLKSFEWEGYRYSPELSTDDRMVFVLDV